MRILTDNKILGALRCPICSASMLMRTDKGNSLVCTGARTHCYDLASSGYVNMCSPSQSGGGDSKQAVRARSDFLSRDFYKPAALELARMCEKWGSKDKVLIDAGCGEGYYSSFACRQGFSVFGVDISKFAADAASKRLTREACDGFFFATASVFEIPVADNSAGVVINIFAPCAEEEFSRVLDNDGILVVAHAGEKHLMGLKKAIYSVAHTNSERADLPVSMRKLDESRVSFSITLTDNSQIMSLFAMTPYYWRTSPEDAEKLAGINELSTEVDIIISVYKNEKDKI